MTSGNGIGWGIVGLGRIADAEIAPAIAASPNGTLVGVVSRDADRAAQFAERHGARSALTDYEALLADPDVDAVYVATPNALHADQVVAAARAGKHVLCDKPLATSVADAERSVAECEAAGVRLGIMFQTRSFEGMDEIRKLIAEGEIGAVRLAQVEISAGRNLPKGWRTDPALAGVGAMNNMGVHAYDLLRHLLGAEVREVTAVVDVEPGWSVDTLALSVLRFDGGALGVVNANQSLPHPQQDLVVHGTEGRIVGRNVTRPNQRGTVSVVGRSGESTRDVSTDGGFLATVTSFAEAVLEGREPDPSGRDGLVSVALTDAMARSVREQRTVPLAG
jgi:1,5-anhydro-D-fructose reductase (1,5-anhydro-D-mannitol-forming)